MVDVGVAIISKHTKISSNSTRVPHEVLAEVVSEGYSPTIYERSQKKICSSLQ